VRREDPEAVHGYRIAARRLRSNVTGFRSLLNAEMCAELAQELRIAAAAVSGARDAEILRRRVESLLQDESGPLVGATWRRLDLMLTEAYGQSLQESLVHLDTPEYDSLTRRLERFADLPPWSEAAERSAEDVFRPLLRHEWARFRARGSAAVASVSDPHPSETLHHARKAAKRARYVAETLIPVFGRRVKRLAKAAQRVQVVLGEHQDCTITQDLLGRADEAAFADGEDGFVLGRMQAREAATAEELREDFVRLFEAADRKQLRRWMR
jgi:CHAD domain-containing protein